MVCPRCKCEAVISKSDYVFNTEEQKLYRKIVYKCRNKKCDKFNNEVGEDKYEIDSSVE